MWDQKVAQMYYIKVNHKQYNTSCCVFNIVALCTSVDKAAIRYSLVDSNDFLTAMRIVYVTLQRFLDAKKQKEK